MNQPQRGERRDRGAVLPLVALLLPVLVLMTAFAVDLGRQRSLRRDLQATVDVVALDLSRIIEDGAAAPSSTSTLNALNESLVSNDMDPVTTSDGSDGALVEWGHWSPPQPSMDCPLTIVTAPPSCFAAGALPINSVRVTLDGAIDYFFQPGVGGATRSAVATRSPRTGLTVGSVAAGLQTVVPGGQAGLNATVAALNARLGASLGATVPSPGDISLDAVSYQGLAATDVEIWRIAEAGGYASPNELLQQNLTVGQFLAFTATALDQQAADLDEEAADGEPNAAAAATRVRTSALHLRRLRDDIDRSVGLDSVNKIQLGNTIDFVQGGDDAAAKGSVNVLDLISGGADVIDGKHFLSYAFNPGVPGIARANVKQYLVRGQTTEFGPVGTTAENKQMAFQVTLDVSPLLGMARPVTVPLVVEAATAQGEITRIECADPPVDSEVDVSVDTGVLKVRIGTASNLAASSPVGTAQAGLVAKAGDLTLTALVNLGLGVLNLGNDLKADGSATLGGADDQLLTFEPLADPNPAKRAPGGLGTTSLGTQLTNSLTADWGLGLLRSTVSANLANQLSYVFTNLDALIVGPLLQATGLTIGGADVRAHDLECSSPMLVE